MGFADILHSIPNSNPPRQILLLLPFYTLKKNEGQSEDVAS